MNIYIDESGIHKTSGLSIICFVYIECKDDNLSKTIEEIENFIGIRKFRWSDFGSKRGWIIRENFIKKISDLDFSFKLSIFTNPIQFHDIFDKTLSRIIESDSVDKIVIDGKKSKRYVHRIKKVLRKEDISVKKVVMMNDKSSGLLRIADALAGLYRSHYEKGNTNTRKLVRLIDNKKTAQFEDGQSAW